MRDAAVPRNVSMSSFLGPREKKRRENKNHVATLAHCHQRTPWALTQDIMETGERAFKRESGGPG